MAEGNGYGSIYGSTWWGSQNTINFNEISFYIYAVDQLKTRALADGGIIEAFECVSKTLRRYPQADRGRQLMDAYDVRVVADSGDTEARTCTINELNEVI